MSYLRSVTKRTMVMIASVLVGVGAVPLAFVGCGTAPSSLSESIAGRSLPKPLSAEAMSRHYVDVLFPEAVDEQAETPTLYTIVTTEGTDLPVTSAKRAEDGKHVILTTGPQEEVTYLLYFGEQPQSADGLSTVAANFTGSTNPEPLLLYATALSNTSVLLTFNLPLEQSSAQTLTNYRIGDPDVNVTAAVRGGGANTHTVVLTTSPQADVAYTVVVTNVLSASGQFLVDPTANTATFFGINRVDTTPPRLLQAEAGTSYDEVVLTFNEPLENHADDVANYSIVPSLAILGAIPNEWGTQVALRTLPLTAGVNYTATVIHVEDRSGNIIDPSFNMAGFIIPADETVPPEVTSVVAIDCQTVLVTFSEPVSENAGDPSNYSFSPDLVVNGAQLSEFKTQVMLTTLAAEAGTEYTLTVTGITDSVGNPIDATHNTGIFKCEAGLNIGALGPLPRVVAASSLDNTSVLVGYDRPMGDSAIDASHYFIVQTNVHGEVGTLVIQAAEFPDPNDKSLVKLTTSSQNEVTYQVTAVAVRDSQGNPLAPKIGFNGLVLLDPTSAIFPGTPPGGDGLVDSDGDGLTDNKELRGYEVVVELAVRAGEHGAREVTRRQVTSNPFLADTDNDELDDGLERLIGSDPRDMDTDDDLVPDEREYNLFYSTLVDQDSDDDGIDDNLETSFFNTSPILADTDGDGFGDGVELFEIARNPNIADLPRPNIIADNIRLQINEKYSFQDTEGRTQTTTSSTEATLTQSTETKFSTSDTDVLKVGVEASLEISATPSLTIGGSFGAEWTTQTTSESSQQAQQQYQSSISRAREISSTRQVTREITGASVSATVTIVNEGDIAFTIGNIEVSALQQGGPNRSRFLPVASLIPAGGNNTFNLGPLVPERGPFVFNNTEVFPNLVEDLMRAPRGLVLKVANFDMTDEFGRNFAFMSQEVNDKTAEIRIDFGDGRKSSNHVATYGGVDVNGIMGTPGEFIGAFDESGLPAGIPLDFALQGVMGMVKNPSAFDAIVAGEDGFANTVAAGDDVQEIPPATGGLDDRAIVVSAGVNGILDTAAPTGDDKKAKTKGYDTSSTCNESTIEKIIEPPNFGDGIASSVKPAVGSDDIQLIAPGAAAAPGATIIAAGPNGVLETVAAGDDVRRGPGDPCTADADCPSGACNGREVITRIENSINGDRNRFWVALTSELLPVGTNVGDVNLQPGFVILLAFIQDVDRDGLSAQEEYLNGSNDRDKDTDDDNIGDFAEVRIGWIVDLASGPYRAFPDPRLADSDGDGASDLTEMNAETDPRLSDTDLDGVDDNTEITDATTMATKNGALCTGKTLEAQHLNPLAPDTDGDGLDDGREFDLGTCPLDREDGPQFLDTDEDGLTNSQETTPHNITYVDCTGVNQIVSVHSDPSRGDTDFDGLPDLLESLIGSNPQDVDTDNDGLLDYDEFSTFALFRHLESEFAGFLLDDATSQKIGTNAADCDSDNDGLTDTFEHEGTWRVLAFGDESARIVQSDPAVFDSDLDGRSDGQEFRGNDGIGFGLPGDSGDATDPTDPDTDGDDRTDGEEVAFGSDPLRADFAIFVRVSDIQALSGPLDGSNNANEWDFFVNVRKPVDGSVFSVLTDQSGFSPTGSNACTNWWEPTTNYTDAPTASNGIQFGLNLGDPFIVEGRWLEVDDCDNGVIIADCISLFSESYTSEQLASMSFVSKTFDLTDGDCHIVFTVEITVH